MTLTPSPLYPRRVFFQLPSENGLRGQAGALDRVADALARQGVLQARCIAHQEGASCAQPLGADVDGQGVSVQGDPVQAYAEPGHLLALISMLTAEHPLTCSFSALCKLAFFHLWNN